MEYLVYSHWENGKEYNKISELLTGWKAKVDKIKYRYNISVLDPNFGFTVLTSEILFCILPLQIQEELSFWHKRTICNRVKSWEKSQTSTNLVRVQNFKHLKTISSNFKSLEEGSQTCKRNGWNLGGSKKTALRQFEIVLQVFSFTAPFGLVVNKVSKEAKVERSAEPRQETRTDEWRTCGHYDARIVFCGGFHGQDV